MQIIEHPVIKHTNTQKLWEMNFYNLPETMNADFATLSDFLNPSVLSDSKQVSLIRDYMTLDHMGGLILPITLRFPEKKGFLDASVNKLSESRLRAHESKFLEVKDYPEGVALRNVTLIDKSYAPTSDWHLLCFMTGHTERDSTLSLKNFFSKLQTLTGISLDQYYLKTPSRESRSHNHPKAVSLEIKKKGQFWIDCTRDRYNHYGYALAAKLV